MIVKIGYNLEKSDMTQAELDYKGPLAGLNVIDFGHYYAGPMAGMLLADQGANVIRVVKPDGSASRDPELPSQQYQLLNRNKKLLELDLKTQAGKAKAFSLIQKADIIIENFRPAVMKRLGLDYASVKAANPSLIYLSLPGFASSDKQRAHIQAWEGVVAAAAGIYTQVHPVRQILGYPPVYTSVPLCSCFSALHGVIAVMSALLARENHGVGTVIEAPLVDAGVGIFSDRYLFRASSGLDKDLPDRLGPFVYCPEDDEKTQIEKLDRATEALLNAYVYKLYPTADKRLMMFHVADRRHFVERYFKALGITDRLKEEGFINEGPWQKMPVDYNLSNVGALSPQSMQRIKQLIERAVKTRTAAEWEAIMAEARVPCTTVRSRAEWLAMEPHLKSGLFISMRDQNLQDGLPGSMLKVPGRLVDVCGPAGALADTGHQGPVPIGVEEITEWTQRVIDNPLPDSPLLRHGKGELLKGLKVLDLSNIVAGPEAAYTLAQYGATVIRSESPGENFSHPYLIKGTLDVAQGKQSILLDLKQLEGRKVFERLVLWADVVLHNVLDDTAKRMGLAHEQLKAINPNIVSCQLSCGGGTYRGGWELRPGFDPIAQLPSGLPAHFGSVDRPQPHGGISIDLMGGLSLAFSGLLGVYQQRKTGYGGEGRASLMRAANYVQLPYMISENGNCDWGEPRGQFAVGPHPWQRLYRCSDRWIYLGTHPRQAQRLAEVVTGRRVLSETALEAAFTRKHSSYWRRILDAAGIACHLVMSLDDLCDAASIRQVDNESVCEAAAPSPEILRWDTHPAGVPVMIPAPTWVRVGENHSCLRLKPAPRLGEHTREVLAQLGYSAEEIDELIRLGVAHEYLPAIGRKDAYLFEPENAQ